MPMITILSVGAGSQYVELVAKFVLLQNIKFGPRGVVQRTINTFAIHIPLHDQHWTVRYRLFDGRTCQGGTVF